MTAAKIEFAEKLAFVLRALAISRGRLASELGVGKSLVSRWVSGVNAPSSYNLGQLTRLIAERQPGFGGLDWDRDLAGLAALFGAALPAGATGAAVGPQFPRLDRVREHTDLHGQAFEGHWFGWRRSTQHVDKVSRAAVWIRRQGGFLAVDTASIGRTSGWLFPSYGKGYMILNHRHSDVPAVFLLYVAEGRRVQIMDGLLLTVAAAATQDLVGGAYVLERHADLLPEADDDIRFFEAQAELESLLPTSEAPPEILPRLMAGLDDGLLRALSEGSLSRQSTLAETRAAAAISAAFMRREEDD